MDRETTIRFKLSIGKRDAITQTGNFFKILFLLFFFSATKRQQLALVICFSAPRICDYLDIFFYVACKRCFVIATDSVFSFVARFNLIRIDGKTFVWMQY